MSTPGLAGLLQLRRLLKTGLTNLHLAAADYPSICRYKHIQKNLVQFLELSISFQTEFMQILTFWAIQGSV